MKIIPLSIKKYLSEIQGLLTITIGEPIFPDLKLSEHEATLKMLLQIRYWMQKTAGFSKTIGQNCKRRSEISG